MDLLGLVYLVNESMEGTRKFSYSFSYIFELYRRFKGDVDSIRIEDLVGSLQTFEASFAKPGKKCLALKT